MTKRQALGVSLHSEYVTSQVAPSNINGSTEIYRDDAGFARRRLVAVPPRASSDVEDEFATEIFRAKRLEVVEEIPTPFGAKAPEVRPFVGKALGCPLPDRRAWRVELARAGQRYCSRRVL